MKNEGLKITKESIDKLFPNNDIGILGYESPITTLTEQLSATIAKQVDENIWEAVVKTNVVVDKDELIKALQYDRGQYEKGYVKGYNAGFYADKWISVEDRLPDDERVLVFLKEKLGNYTRLDTDRRVNDKWVRWEGSVTHWMPLPEPPKESEDEI